MAKGALLSFEVVGGQAVEKGLASLLDKVKDLTPFWREVFAPKYFAMVEDLFKTGGRARGGGGKFKSGAWAPLSPAYRIWKQEHYPGRPILVRTGALYRSVRWTGKGKSGNLGTGGIFEPGPQAVTVGTNIFYGKYHEYGTAKMVARSFLPLPDPKVFAPLLQAWLTKKKGQ